MGLPRLRFGSGNSDVMVPAHGFSLSVESGKFHAIVTAFETATSRPDFEARNQFYFTGLGASQIRNR